MDAQPSVDREQAGVERHAPQAARRKLTAVSGVRVASPPGTVLGMLVTDLNHFLDLPEDTPGPARRLAGHLSNIVRAATAGDAGTAWESALPCRRRRPTAAARAG